MADVDVSGGFFWLWRKMFKRGSEFKGDMPLTCTWIHILARAAHAPTDIASAGKRLQLLRGQLVIGTREFSDEIGCTRQQLRRTIKQLANNQRITHQPTHLGTIITVLNYDTYQPKKLETTQDRTRGEHADNQQTTTNNKGIKELKEEYVAPEGPTPPLSLVKNEPDQKIGLAPSDLAAIWNANRRTCGRQKVLPLNAELARKVKVRIGEHPDPEFWVTTIRKMAASTFCCEGKWASFDWLVKNQSNCVKAFEGNYDDKDPNAAVPAKQRKYLTGEDVTWQTQP